MRVPDLVVTNKPEGMTDDEIIHSLVLMVMKRDNSLKMWRYLCYFTVSVLVVFVYLWKMK